MRYQNSYAQLDPRLYHKQPPSALNNPRAGHFNSQVAEQLGWSTDQELMERWVEIVGGEYVPEGFEPLAMAYAGHQFGQWAGQLGDGRGLLMAQVLDNNTRLAPQRNRSHALFTNGRWPGGAA